MKKLIECKKETEIGIMQKKIMTKSKIKKIKNLFV